MSRFAWAIVAALIAMPALAQVTPPGPFGPGPAPSSGGGPPSGSASGDLGGSYPGPTVVSVAHVSAGVLPAANGGAGTVNGALKANGSGTVSQAAASDLSNGTTGSGAVVLVTSPTLVTPVLGVASATSIQVTGSTCPTNGMYLGAANQLNFCTNSTNRFAVSSTGSVTFLNSVLSNNNDGYRLASAAASATAPTLVPRQSDLKAGIGADAAGDVSIIADNATVATEMVRITGTSMSMQAGLLVRKGYTVSTLPTGITGGEAYVTDAVACAFGSTPTGSGSTFCPVIYNGSAWIGG